MASFWNQSARDTADNLVKSWFKDEVKRYEKKASEFAREAVISLDIYQTGVLLSQTVGTATLISPTKAQVIIGTAPSVSYQGNPFYGRDTSTKYGSRKWTLDALYRFGKYFSINTKITPGDISSNPDVQSAVAGINEKGEGGQYLKPTSRLPPYLRL